MGPKWFTFGSRSAYHWMGNAWVKDIRAGRVFKRRKYVQQCSPRLAGINQYEKVVVKQTISMWRHIPSALVVLERLWDEVWVFFLNHIFFYPAHRQADEYVSMAGRIPVCHKHNLALAGVWITLCIFVLREARTHSTPSVIELCDIFKMLMGFKAVQPGEER